MLNLTRDTSVGLRNRELRRQMLNLHCTADALFNALCNASSDAPVMEELWRSGEFDCEPQDYSFIVELCLTAVREYNEHRRTISALSTCCT